MNTSFRYLQLFSVILILKMQQICFYQFFQSIILWQLLVTASKTSLSHEVKKPDIKAWLPTGSLKRSFYRLEMKALVSYVQYCNEKQFK